jgi:hypothetical protein
VKNKNKEMIIINPINAAVFGTEPDLLHSRKRIVSVTTAEDTSQPGPTDVICARGKRAFNHEGNIRFRRIVESKMDVYSQAKTKLEKTVIVSQIIDGVRQTQPAGGFLREEDEEWVEVGDAVAREKVGQG